MNKNIFTIIGFVLFILGTIAVILSLVGLNLTILAPLESLGAGIAFLIKIIMIVFGLILVYVVRTTTDE